MVAAPTSIIAPKFLFLTQNITICCLNVFLPHPKTLKCLMAGPQKPGWVWQLGAVAWLPQNWELSSCFAITPTGPASWQPAATCTAILSQIWPLFRPGSQPGTGASVCSITEGWLQFSPWRTFGFCRRVNEPTQKPLAALPSSQSDPSLLSARIAGQGFVFHAWFPSACSAVTVLDKGSDKMPKP